MSDFRALCEELLENLEESQRYEGAYPITARARAALADPAPVVGDAVPSDAVLQDILDLAMKWFQPGSDYTLGDYRRDARAVLARYAGTAPAPVPVPVSERLPGAEDCDAEGRCWVHQPSDVSPEAPTWVLLPRKYASATYRATEWLPAHALPLPEVTP